MNSIYNNYVRWRESSGSESNNVGEFVDFMQKRWAPIGVKNDPKGLNKNWSGNVKSILGKILND